MRKIIAPAIAAFIVSTSPDASAQVGSIEGKRPELEAYRHEVQNNIQNFITPTGLLPYGIRGETMNNYHFGYPVGKSGWSIGLNHTRMKGTPLFLGNSRNTTSLGVSFILEYNILK